LRSLRLLGFLSFGLTAPLFFLVPTIKIRPARDELQEVLVRVQSKDVQASELGDIPEILSILVSHTKFSGHLNLNGKLETEALNVYVLAPNLKQRADAPKVFYDADVFDNCAYAGESNAIICDSDFLARFLPDHRIDWKSLGRPQTEAGWTYQDAFLAWIFGHELGHVLEGGPAAHFGIGDALDKPMDAAIQFSQMRETEADLYAAKQIELNKKLTATLEGLLIDLMNQEIERKNGKSSAYGVGLNWDYADKSVIAYFADKDHPEYVIRATRMLQFLAQDLHEEGLTSLLNSFARHLVLVNTPHN
jgi:hypothetical protein